jgi:hypothetical protein
MHTHEQDSDILVFDDISEAGIFHPNWLRRKFNPHIPKAAVHHSAKLEAFCASIDYERDGFCDVFNQNSTGLLHSISTIYSKGRIDTLYFDTLFRQKEGDYHPQMSKKAFLVPGMHQYYGRWSDIFQQYGDYIRPGFGSEFGLRIVSRTYSAIDLHTDHKRYDKIACTPLGDQKPATIVLSESGELVEFERSSTVFTKRGCVHTSPVSPDMRVIISANPLEKDPFTGLALGFGS